MADQPPSYQQATGSSSTSKTGLQAPQGGRAGIPLSHRRSMQDEARDLPAGWVRQYDSKSSHQYFVDTRASPPRSIWHHPYDDQTYLESLPSAERERVEELHHKQSREGYVAADSDVEDVHHDPPLPPRTSKPSDASAKGPSKFGRKLKDRVTGTTHEQREAERRQQAEADEEAYRRHQHMRAAMARAQQTGEPQLLGPDKDGNNVYIEPPNYARPVGQDGRYYNPYTQGPYTQPGARFIPYPVPQQGYGARPYGYGYGGYGYGGGMGLPLMGGLMGGAMLGGLMF